VSFSYSAQEFPFLFPLSPRRDWRSTCHSPVVIPTVKKNTGPPRRVHTRKRLSLYCFFLSSPFLPIGRARSLFFSPLPVRCRECCSAGRGETPDFSFSSFFPHGREDRHPPFFFFGSQLRLRFENIIVFVFLDRGRRYAKDLSCLRSLRHAAPSRTSRVAGPSIAGRHARFFSFFSFGDR